MDLKEDLKEALRERLHIKEIKRISTLCQSDELKSELYQLVADADERVGYNALWIFTHLPRGHGQWLRNKRDELIDRLLSVTHIGQRRLLLTLLENQPLAETDVRSDYLDYCLSGINSCEPYATRALCLKQAYAQCRFYPELMRELMAEIELMDCGEMSPGLRSARKNILKKLQSSVLPQDLH
ncbi:MAG: hypothetical protein K2M97_07525 [Muribaculaceae bacterium]|nr:hypothetical protein [Muribaculaceae bacterium]